jgi:hypothetical protein
VIRYLRVGEGGYRHTKQQIIDLLGESSGACENSLGADFPGTFAPKVC